MKIKLPTQSYRSAASRERLQNCYAEAQSGSAKSDVIIKPCPGIISFTTVGVGPIRGMRKFLDHVYAVSGTELYRFDSTGAVEDLGGAVSGTDPVVMEDNGDQVMIVNGENGYIWSEDTGFIRITDSDFSSAKTVTNTDGFFVTDRVDTNEFAFSDSLDGLSWDGTFFATAEWKSDNVVRPLNHLGRLNIFGEASTEVWGFTGAVNLPYQRIQGAEMELGLIGAYALTTDKESIYIIGHDRCGYRIAGGVEQITNRNPALEEEWQGYAVVDDAIVFTHMWAGHQFVYFTFPTINKTFCMDRNTGLFHERVSWDEFNNSLGRWRVNCVCDAFRKLLVGDGFSGKVGYLDSNTYTEFGNTMQADMVFPPIHADGKTVFMPWLELDMQTGEGLTSGQGSAPQIMLAISDDGGSTFDSPEEWASMGQTGVRLSSIRWDSLGSFEESRYLRLVITDPVPRTIMSARCPGLRAGS